MSINRMQKPSQANWSLFHKELRENHQQAYKDHYERQTAAITASIQELHRQQKIKVDAQLYRNKGIKNQ